VSDIANHVRYQTRVVNPVKSRIFCCPGLSSNTHHSRRSSSFSSFLSRSELDEVTPDEKRRFIACKIVRAQCCFPCHRAVCITPVRVISISTTCIVHLKKNSVSVAHLSNPNMYFVFKDPLISKTNEKPLPYGNLIVSTSCSTIETSFFFFHKDTSASGYM